MYSIDYIHTALNYYFIEKLSFNKISKKLDVSRQIISIWIKNFTNNMLFLSNRNKSKQYKIPVKIRNYDLQLFIKHLIYINPFIHRKQIILDVYIKFKITLTLNNISKIYKILNMTRKNPKYHIVKNIKYMDELIEKRKIFLEKVNQLNINKIISIDESGFNKLLPFNKGLSIKGTNIHVPVKCKVNKNISLLLAITTNGVLNLHISKENINSIIFREFIKNTITKLESNNYTFLFDNVPFHHNKEMLESIKSSGNHYVFTPPYSPNNNPIESVFSIVKNKYKKLINNNNNIENNILITINIIKNNNFMSIFNRSLKYSYIDIEKELKDRLIFML